MPAMLNRIAAPLALSLALAGCGPQPGEPELTSAQAPASLATLRAAAEASGRFFGVALQGSKLSDSQYTTIAAREFDMATPENELKTLAMSPGTYNFTPGDAIYNWATQHGMRVHGHSLLWLTGLPAYLGSYDRTSMQAYISSYIATVGTHYRGRFAYWDVVSEAFYDTGVARSPVYRVAGEDWMEQGFRAARAADPGVKLCYDDYGIESWTSAKTQAVYAMVKSFKSRGVPIDCVGFQSHFTDGSTVPSTFQTTLENFARLGVEVMLTELEVTNASPSIYASAVNACLAVAGCTGITVWGVRDGDSWRAAEGPLLFDSSGQKKPAYTAVLNALNQAVPAGGGGGGAVDTQPPSAPGAPSWMNQGVTTVTLTWAASTDDQGVAGYQLLYGNLLLGTFDSPSVTLIGLRPGNPYQFSLKAFDAAGNVSAASGLTVLIPIPVDTTAPTAPTNLRTVEWGGTVFTFTWTASTDDVGVVIYQIFDGTRLVGTTLGTTATVAYGSSPSSLSITVRAVDAAGNVSAASQPLSTVATPCALGCSGGSSEL